jgi:hypothetical protein
MARHQISSAWQPFHAALNARSSGVSALDTSQQPFVRRRGARAERDVHSRQRFGARLTSTALAGQSEESAMTWGIPTTTFLQIHVVLSLIGIGSGFVVLYGLVSGKSSGVWTALFLVTTVLTSITGFPLPPFGFDPPRAVGVISLILLTVAVVAAYGFHLGGPWRSAYILTAVAALYLNVFVGVIQAFRRLWFLQPLAPTQSEPPFLITQLAVLGIFLALGVLALIRFRPNATPRI